MVSIRRPEGALLRVLVTRPFAQAQKTARRISLSGVGVPVIVPMMQVESVEGWSLPDERPVGIIISSMNAVPALSRLPFGWRREVPFYAVGSATGEAVRGMCSSCTVESADGNSESLCALIRERVRPESGVLLHLSGEVLSADYADVLAGYRVDRRVVYQAQEIEVLPDADVAALGTVDVALAYSPRSARVLAKWMPIEARARVAVLCLSDAVAQAAGEGWRAVRVASCVDEGALLSLLEEV